jgi:hypothetical protein
MPSYLRPVPIEDLKKAAFTEPLTENTKRMRRSLLIYSGISILVKIYNLKIKTLPGLNLDIPENAPHLIEGALAIVVVYMLTMFILYIWQDLQRWWLEGNIVVFKHYSDLLSYTRDDIHAIKESIARFDDADAGKKLKIQEINQVINDALERIPKSAQQMSSMVQQYVRLTILQWTRLVVFEISLPILVSVIALVKIGNSLYPFIMAVFN